jgi:UDP-galactopyranose mutase
MKTVILGGGPAGCAAAYCLKREGIDDITIIEETPRLGGMSHTRFYDNIPYEYGPQILYTEDPKLQQVFDEFLTLFRPPSEDGRYHPLVSTDGRASGSGVHNFPITFENVLRLPKPHLVIEELYQVNLAEPDFSSFENYAISRMGRTLYELYVKNYNIKQWLVHPRDMDAEWARFRPLTLRNRELGMFKSDFQGHPGDYNPLWSGMTAGVRVVQGRAAVSNDFSRVEVDGDPITADLVVSTLPLSSDLDFVNTCLVYVVLDSDTPVMGSYATSFPNNYGFVRIMEYRQQFGVQSEHTLLDFQFPWKGVCEQEKYEAAALGFIREEFPQLNVREVWCDIRKNVYPVSTGKNLSLVAEQLRRAASSNVVPLGRMGVHAYVSKDTCIRMAMQMAEGLQSLDGSDPAAKSAILARMRERLT